ncbi:GFA family protein [Aspergillus glaucus CBS 516.65]|uniref:CENP-V/GFA domain-containing protein n=1 Tax=Aspergillus glaucus CBS 516.65 TaxID=1160497 RepID=A0A1L9VUP2_ASPGL|nr:hypothetical protein ASPGLDRAFT_118127 [Aspergillus glaucus CBS 516.65]OJJ87632.1 hypothetical protein ASPGLDRAFT_118127 [Aspergillus glaucus CBS 516.65]
MPFKGVCNCGNIQVSLDQQPENTLVCHCRNCTKAGGGPFSINYAVEDSTANINDPHASLKIYKDANTDSGNRIQRQFCGNCGSPILSKSPKYPGMSIFKAMLFEELAPPSKEVFTGSRVGFVKPIEGAEQA